MASPTSYTYISADEIIGMYIETLGYEYSPRERLKDMMWRRFRKTHDNWGIGKSDEWYEKNRDELMERCSFIEKDIKEVLKNHYEN